MRGIGIAFLVLLLAGSANAQQKSPVNPPRKSPKSFCRAPEVALYNCDAKDTFASICQHGRKVVFRFAMWSWRQPDLESVSNDHDGVAHRVDFLPFGHQPNGNGELADQRHIRFSWRGLDFIAHVTDYGEDRYVSGLEIEKDNLTLVHKICRPSGLERNFRPPKFLKYETDEKYRAIY